MWDVMQRNYLRLIPLLVVGVVWVIGYVYTYKLVDFGLCELGTYTCGPLMDNFGYPYMYLAYWYLPIAIGVFVFPAAFLKRWIMFVAPFFLFTVITISNSRSDEGGMFWGEKFYVAIFYGFLMMAITIIWLAVHLFISRRKSRP